MRYFSKYLNRDMEYQGPPSWASDTDQYKKAHTVGLKTHTKNPTLAYFRIDHVCLHAPVPDNETDSSDRGTCQHIFYSKPGRGGMFELGERVQK